VKKGGGGGWVFRVRPGKLSKLVPP